MRALWRLLLVATLVSMSAYGVEAAGPFARAAVETKGTIVPGQQIELSVDVLVPNFFTSPPQFPLIDIDNAVVTLPDQRALNLNETVDDVEYSGIRKVYDVVPQTAGSFTLPAVSIPLSYRDDNGQTVTATVAIPPISFQVGANPANADGGPVFAAQKVVISQSFDRKPETLKSGEALVRTVTIYAGNTQAMMIPAPEFAAPAGVEVYREAPSLADNVEGNDGGTGSSRTERVTYIINETGTFQLPSVSLDWYDTATHRLEKASAPAVTATVTAAPSSAQTIAPQLSPARKEPVRSIDWRMITLTALALIVAGALIYALLRFAWPSAKAHIHSYAERRAQSELASFKRLVAALGGDDAWTAYRALDAWTKRCGFRSIAAWASTIQDGQLRAQVEALQQALFAGGQSDAGRLDLADLRQRITAARRGLLSRPAREGDHSALPRLNP